MRGGLFGTICSIFIGLFFLIFGPISRNNQELAIENRCGVAGANANLGIESHLIAFDW